MELDGEKIKDTKSLDALIEGTYKGLVSTTQTKGANPATPPANTGGVKTREDIYKKDDKGRYVMSTSERQSALAELMASETNN